MDAYHAEGGWYYGDFDFEADCKIVDRTEETETKSDGPANI